VTRPRVDPPARGLTVGLEVAAGVALLLAALGMALPDTPALSGAAIAVIIAIPLVRVALLGLRWYRDGDHRFACVAGGLLVIITIGALLAAT
jgi:hypothetical protein